MMDVDAVKWRNGNGNGDQKRFNSFVFMRQWDDQSNGLGKT